MAPRRILRSFSAHSLPLYLLGIIISVLVMASCGASKKAADTSASSSKNTANTENSGVSDEFIALLQANRSELSDVYASKENDIPDVFLKQSTARSIGDPNQGYRIQILSTQDVSQADSIANDFRFWADSSMTDYTPKAYVFFKQPYYKVHVGNFQFHDQALKLNRMLKARYPGAWVVHDNIEPGLVPPDTTHFGSKNQ